VYLLLNVTENIPRFDTESYIEGSYSCKQQQQRQQQQQEQQQQQ
jgi:hypothetical protein